MVDIRDEQTRDFIKPMTSPDDFSVVIKGGFYLEIAVTDLIEACLRNPEQLRSLQLDYAGKCALAVGLGLDPEYLKPLNALGTVRYAFAHKLRASNLTKGDTNNLCKSLSRELKSYVNEEFTRIIKRRRELNYKFAKCATAGSLRLHRRRSQSVYPCHQIVAHAPSRRT